MCPLGGSLVPYRSFRPSLYGFFPTTSPTSSYDQCALLGALWSLTNCLGPLRLYNANHLGITVTTSPASSYDQRALLGTLWSLTNHLGSAFTILPLLLAPLVVMTSVPSWVLSGPFPIV